MLTTNQAEFNQNIEAPAPISLSATFVMEQVLGHITHYQNLCRAAELIPGLQANFVELTYRNPRSVFNHLPRVSPPLKGYAIGLTQTGGGLWRGRKDEIVFFHTQKPAVLWGQLPRRRPWVLSLDVTPVQYDRMSEFYGESGDQRGLKEWFKYAMNKRLFKSASLIVSWSDWVRRSLMEDYDVDSSKIAIIPPGVDFTRWSSHSDPQPLTPNPLPHLLFCGGDWERKGGPLLLDWYKRRGRDLCELHLVTRYRFSQAEIEGAGSKLFIYNNLNSNDPDLIKLYHQADLFVLPTRAECFGIAYIEAMALGLPVITTNVAAAPEIVLEGETGYLIEPQDVAALETKIETLLQDPALRQKMGEAARQRACTRYNAIQNWKATLQRMAELV